MCGGAETGVWLVAVPWKMGHPVAGRTGCRGLWVEGVWWAECSAVDVSGEVVLGEGIVVELDVVLWVWELEILNGGLVAECGWGWSKVVGSWNACGAGCRQ